MTNSLIAKLHRSKRAPVQRATRNRRLAQAAGAGAAMLAIIGGVILATNSDTNDEVRASPPPVTDPTVTNPPGSHPPDNTTPDASDTAPQFVYVANPLSGDTGERVVDLATGEIVRTQPRNGAAYPENWLERRTRVDSAQLGITYHKQEIDDLDPGDFIDLCGQGKVVVENGPDGDLAVPTRAMDLAVSPDGRWVIVASTICPVDGAMVPGEGVPADMPDYEVQIQVFDADDPSAPGRPLTTTRTAIAEVPQIRFSDDGRWAALSSFQPTAGRTFEIFDLTTAEVVTSTHDDGCINIAYNQQDGLFIGNDAVAELQRCFDVMIVKITPLTDPTDPARFTLTNVNANDTMWGTLEVWPNLPDDMLQATFVASLSEIDVRDAGRTFAASGGRVEELPYPNTHISFDPLPLSIGGS